MSHKIIIRSDAQASNDAQSANNGAQVSCVIEYTPSHGEGDRETLARVGKLMKLMRKMEESIGEGPNSDES